MVVEILQKHLFLCFFAPLPNQGEVCVCVCVFFFVCVCVRSRKIDPVQLKGRFKTGPFLLIKMGVLQAAFSS